MQPTRHPYEYLLDHCLELGIEVEALPEVLDVPGYLYASDIAVPIGFWPGSDEVIDALASICATKQYWSARYASYEAQSNG